MSIIKFECAERDCDPAFGSIEFHLSRALNESEQAQFEDIACDCAGADNMGDYIACDAHFIPACRAFLESLN